MPENQHAENENADPEQPSPSIDTHPVRKTNKTNSSAEVQRPHWADRTVAVFTILIFLTYITSDYFLWRQWQITGGQLDQIKASSSQTDKLIPETHTLATNAGIQAANAADEVKKLSALVEATNKQASSARGQLSVMQKQLAIANRPWINVELAPDGPIEFEDRGARIFFTATMTNVGHSVAVNVEVSFGAANDTDFGTNQIEAVCRDYGRDRGRGDVVFSGQALTRHFFAEIPRADLLRPVRFLRSIGDSGNRLFAPMIFGCVDYQFDFIEGHHQTWFAYTVRTTSNTGQAIFPAKDEGDIPLSKITMSKELSAGHWAN